MDSELAYIKPPPPYPPIAGSKALARGETNNLWTRFLDMNVPADDPGAASGGREFGIVFTSTQALLSHRW